LGHTSIKTTEVYLAYLTGEEAKAAMFGTGTGQESTVPPCATICVSKSYQ
jgi:hypothetical protein